MTATDLLTFDSTDEGPDQDFVDFMRRSYWVCVYMAPHTLAEPARGDEWLMSHSRPVDVDNGNMHWRRPTYEEVLNHLDWLERLLPVRDLGEYRRSGPVPPLCVCGHGQDSHRMGILQPLLHCRSQCFCGRFTSLEAS